MNDLQSRIDSFVFIGIDLPTDDLLEVIISKSFSDMQINIDPKISSYIIKNIDRSYEKMFKFIQDIDELSLSSAININLIKKSIEIMKKFRTHNCSQLNENEIDKNVILSGGYTEKEIMEI